MSTVLIMSGTYVASELAAEFGALPPSFLPVGGRRLFELQLAELAPPTGAVYMTIPADYAISSSDKYRLDEKAVRLLRMPPDLRLGAAVAYAIDLIDNEGDFAMRILHGDTLILNLPDDVPNSYSVHETASAYRWASVSADPESGLPVLVEADQSGQGSEAGRVVSGHFSFSSARLLHRALTQAEGDFIAGLNGYGLERPLSPVESGTWLDFGHLQTFYRSRWIATTERAFNALNISKYHVEKWSAQEGKIQAEIHWYQNIPPQLRSFVPALIGTKERQQDGKTNYGYVVSNLYLTAIRELFVFCRLGINTWRQIFAACGEFLEICAGLGPTRGSWNIVDALYLPKTLDRLDLLARDGDISIDREWRINGRVVPSLAEIAEAASSIVDSDAARPAVMHGDFCGSNILYDFRSESIRVVDPRGSVDGDEPTIYGDLRYDVAKLHHSVVGLYDHIVSGFCDFGQDGAQSFNLAFPDDLAISATQDCFLRQKFAGYRTDSAAISAISVLLFLSMIPLHNDDPKRQRALLANALRLYDRLDV